MPLLGCHANQIDKTFRISFWKSENPNHSKKLQKAAYKTYSQQKNMSYASHLNWLFRGIKYQTEFPKHKSFSFCGPVYCLSPRHKLPI